MVVTQYYRIEKMAGGACATRRQILKAARNLLCKKGKTFELREQRHNWLRRVLEIHENSQRLG